MRNLTKNEFELFEFLVTSTQKTLLNQMSYYLKSLYKDNIIITKDYIVAIGDIPIALVAHLDTVFPKPVKELYYDKDKNVIWSPEGLGSDDRAGVFAILKILETGLRPSIIFTTDEEKGGIGAYELSKLSCPIKGLKYIIELDRRGQNDCVFYDCITTEFIEYIEGFGFKTNFGSFSDISFLCPDWEICGVNLSIGYENEHSLTEILFVDYMLQTIDKVIFMLNEKNIPKFKYEENNYISLARYYASKYDYTKFKCSKCGKSFFEYEVIPVKENKKTKFYCEDCFTSENINWCSRCQEPYKEYLKPDNGLCKDCAGVVKS